MLKRILYILFIIAGFIGCKSHEEPQAPTLILEGWIDAGDAPVVLIHRSYVMDNYSPDQDTVKTIEDVMEDLLIPFGKVTVSDGTNEVVLTGRIDTAYMPPYTYSSLYMTGQAGKTYTVTAKYKDLYATATTTIPPVAKLDSLRVRRMETDIDIHAYMTVNPKEEAYYALFLREYKKEQFQLCPFGVFENKDAVNGQMDIKLYNPYSVSNEMVSVAYDIANPIIDYQLKIARIDYRSYLFWKAYNEQIITRGTLFVPVYRNIPGNVNGGKGIFCGMGSSIYRFSLTPDSLYRF